MAITLTNADKALKTFYLDAVSEQLDKSINPFYAAIEKSTSFVSGKEVKMLTSIGVNGGIGAGTEDGDLPNADGSNYRQFTSTLKNLYGVIQISDKAVRASENNAGAFVNLLDAEMDSLLKASKFNFGRMLFGDGSGNISKVSTVENSMLKVDNVQNFYTGMIVELRESNGDVVSTNLKVGAVDYEEKLVEITNASLDANLMPPNVNVYVQGSFNNEISGLGAIFGRSNMLYGIDKTTEKWLKPYVKNNTVEVTETDLQKALDTIEQNSGGTVNLIICSYGVRRKLQKMFSENRVNIDTVELAGGFKVMSYNGIPIVADRFCPKGTMYLLNTNDFCLHQLCDWQWLEGDDGKVLQQVPGKPVYTATLVKYAELMCSRPNGQGAILGIEE